MAEPQGQAPPSTPDREERLNRREQRLQTQQQQTSPPSPPARALGEAQRQGSAGWSLSSGGPGFMDTLGSPKAMVTMFFTAAGMEVWKELKGGFFPPRPQRFTGIALVYGLLSVLGSFWAPVAGILGLGLTMALATKIGSTQGSGQGSTGASTGGPSGAGASASGGTGTPV